VIVINTIILFVSNPKEDKNLNDKTVYYFLAYYTFDTIISIISYGFILNEGSYIRNPWSVYEFLVLIIGYIEKIFGKT